ncbi:MAG: hypothetical protein NWT00_03615 [Beijerinckiaceae bacterium]|jgi:hypothetical protein|nr:hypothetical protein [Beijerinckiaceae bacterium]
MMINVSGKKICLAGMLGVSATASGNGRNAGLQSVLNFPAPDSPNPFTHIANAAIAAATGCGLLQDHHVLRQNAQRDRLPRHHHVAIYLAHVVFGLSQRNVGRMFGRDRTTIRYACARVEDARDDPLLDFALNALTAGLAIHAVSIAQLFQKVEVSHEYTQQAKVRTVSQAVSLAVSQTAIPAKRSACAAGDQAA